MIQCPRCQGGREFIRRSMYSYRIRNCRLCGGTGFAEIGGEG